MWCNWVVSHHVWIPKRVERVFSFRHRWCRSNIIRETRLKKLIIHSLCLKRFVSLQYHSIIPSKGMNLFSNQINQILIFHNYLLMNFLLMICILLFYYYLSIIHNKRTTRSPLWMLIHCRRYLFWFFLVVWCLFLLYLF